MGSSPQFPAGVAVVERTIRKGRVRFVVRPFVGSCGLSPDSANMMAFVRWLVRVVLGVVLFLLALPALTAVSLLAMYSDHRVLD